LISTIKNQEGETGTGTCSGIVQRSMMREARTLGGGHMMYF
jgi:hypothetical protein